MNSLCRVREGEGFYIQQPSVESPSLPAELYQYIFRHLRGIDLQHANLVCRMWNVQSLECARKETLFSIRVFIKFMQVNLTINYISEKEQLLMQHGSNDHEKFNNSQNLQELKSLIIEQRVSILNILQNVDLKELARLIVAFLNLPYLYADILKKTMGFTPLPHVQELYKKELELIKSSENKMPQFFENIFEKMETYKHASEGLRDYRVAFEGMFLIDDMRLRDSTFRFLHCECLEKALEAVNLISEESTKKDVLHQTILWLLKKWSIGGSTEKAIELLKVIPAECERKSGLVQEVALKILTRRRGIDKDKGMEVVNMLDERERITFFDKLDRARSDIEDKIASIPDFLKAP